MNHGTRGPLLGNAAPTPIIVRIGTDLTIIAFRVLTGVLGSTIGSVVHALVHSTTDVFAKVVWLAHEVLKARRVGVPTEEETVTSPIAAFLPVDRAFCVRMALIGIVDAPGLAVDEIADLAVGTICGLTWNARAWVDVRAAAIRTARAARRRVAG